MSQATVQIQPDTLRLQAFTIEAVASELAKHLREDANPSINGHHPVKIIQELASSMRSAAAKAETEHENKAANREDRKARRAQRGSKGSANDFSGDDFPSAEAFGLAPGFQGGGGGQVPLPPANAFGMPPPNTAAPVPSAPGLPPIPQAAPVAATAPLANKEFNDESI